MRIDLKLVAALGVVALGFAAGPANAQERVRAGLLDCRSAGHTGFIIGSVAQYQCVFQPDYGPREGYDATLSRFGADVGVTTSNNFVWSVLAPTRRLGRGEIAGNYVGVGASATVGVGAAVNLLVGGSNNSYALQPLSVQTSTGLNAAGGLASLELRPVQLMRPAYRHHRHGRRHHRR
jgi:hypothetical protein